MGIPIRRILRLGLALGVVATATAISPYGVTARSTHDVTHYDRKQISTQSDGTKIYLETMVVKGKHSKELQGVKDWKAYADETTLQLTTAQADAGYYDYTYWYTAGCRITAIGGLGPNYFYQLTHDYGYSDYREGNGMYRFVAAEGDTNEAWSTWWGWNILSHSIGSRYVMSRTYLPDGSNWPYQEYITGNYNMGHGVTTPWGNVIIESHAGWVKPVYGPGPNVSCYQS